MTDKLNTAFNNILFSSTELIYYIQQSSQPGINKQKQVVDGRIKEFHQLIDSMLLTVDTASSYLTKLKNARDVPVVEEREPELVPMPDKLEQESLGFDDGFNMDLNMFGGEFDEMMMPVAEPVQNVAAPMPVEMNKEAPQKENDELLSLDDLGDLDLDWNF